MVASFRQDAVRHIVQSSALGIYLHQEALNKLAITEPYYEFIEADLLLLHEFYLDRGGFLLQDPELRFDLDCMRKALQGSAMPNLRRKPDLAAFQYMTNTIIFVGYQCLMSRS